MGVGTSSLFAVAVQSSVGVQQVQTDTGAVRKRQSYILTGRIRGQYIECAYALGRDIWIYRFAELRQMRIRLDMDMGYGYGVG